MTAQAKITQRYIVQEAHSPDAIRDVQRLRHRAFFGRPGIDQDRFDTACRHFAVRDQRNGAVVGGFRALVLANGAQAAQSSYSAQFYDLAPLAVIQKPLLELGRVCVEPDTTDPDVLRLAWGALAQIVNQLDVALIFGCSSFAGADATRHSAALSRLNARHLGPAALRPKIKSADAVALPLIEGAQNTPLPPLLRTYLMMGGWVGDHAVQDTQMQTTHIFTALEIDAIPENRRRLLMAWQG